MQADEVKLDRGYMTYTYTMDHQDVVEDVLHPFNFGEVERLWQDLTETLFVVAFDDHSVLFFHVSGSIFGAEAYSYGWLVTADPVSLLRQRFNTLGREITRLKQTRYSTARAIARLQRKTLEVTFICYGEAPENEYYDEDGFRLMFKHDFQGRVIEWEYSQGEPSADQILAAAREHGSVQVIHKEGYEIVVKPLR